ncbi:MAG: helix-turn-helix protein [Clostridiaceae bacterium]|nr:helix-turn-helix protein [Clostridiaceae bacterium]
MNTKLLKIQLVKKDMTVIELAEKIGVNVNTVSRWMNGNNLNQIEKFLEMLKVLDVNYKDLIIEENVLSEVIV